MGDQMIKELENIYSKTMDYFVEKKDEDPDLFLKVGSETEVGFAILYTPPIYNPKILICGQNPGNFGYSWDDQYNQEMLNGEIPTVNTYTAGRDGVSYPFNFAKFIRSQFDLTPARKELLDKDTVGMNIYPFQYNGTPKLTSEKRKDYLKTFHRLSIQTVRAINPQKIICISVKAFDVLNKKEAKNIKQHEHGGRYSGKGFFGDIPVYLVGHPASYTPDELLYKALDNAIKEIESE